MARARHYRNSKEPGIALFVTTTVLDFVHAFGREDARWAMVRQMARQCRLARVTLHAFVVMPHHVHLVIQLPASLDGPTFVGRLKTETGKAVSRFLTAAELSEFHAQRGLNRNTFWQYSFRSVPILTPTVFWQKVGYTHENPVRRGYVESAEDYLWSSASLFARGLWTEEGGLPLREIESFGLG